MSSNRPETSVPNTSSESAETSTNNEKGSSTTYRYVPNVFDLVFPTRRARDATSSSIPLTFLQSDAVDSSLLIGSGASFTVTRQAIPPGPEKIKVKTDMGGWIVEKVINAPKRPSYVVYKSARVRFQANGDPATAEDGRAMLSVLTEFHALLHPPLRSHPNIITLLGLAWGSNQYDPLHRLPVLVVEYGDKGTLADIQSRATSPTKAVKVDLCRGIAYGLQALHGQGIIHGDLKPENVIICTDKDGALVPKLADFGFAMMEISETESRYIAGTRTWRAPESFSLIPVIKLRHTDIYSFGLVVWSIVASVNDPFSLVLPPFESYEARFAEIDRLKMSDELLKLSQLDNWFLSWMLETYGGNNSSTTANQQETGSMNQVAVSARQLAAKFKDVPPTVRRNLSTTLKSFPAFIQVSQLCFPRNLDSIFECTLTRDPDKRNLEIAIKFLEDQEAQPPPKIENLSLQTSQPENAVLKNTNSEHDRTDSKSSPSIESNQNAGSKWLITNTSNETRTFRRTPIPKNEPKLNLQTMQSEPKLQTKIDWQNLGFKYHRYSWQVVRDLEPAVQRFVVKSLSNVDDGPALFVLSACLINGYGIAPDAQRAVDCMVEAALKGHPFARANLHRMAAVCGKQLSADVPVLAYLKQAALDGSRPALLDLCLLDPKEGKHYRDVLRYGYGGVGASWFAENQWLHGLNQGSFLNADFKIESLGSREELPNIVVNLRGDRIVHAAAATGANGLLKPLLEDRILDVNQRNALGETAILCACRSGQADTVLLLLNNGANASLQALNGESPLHWFSSFIPSVNPASVGKDLIERGGAQVDAFTTERVSHSQGFRSIDVDFQMPGTPLAWAVHDNNHLAVAFLLSKGADPNWRLSDTELSPLEWAAFYHHAECLKRMVEHLEKTVEGPVTTEGKKDIRHTVQFEPLVRHAVHAADNFSMVLRNGASCLNMLRATLSYLQEKTKLVRFKINSEHTLLHFAAHGGHGEAIRFILEQDWLLNEINDPVGRSGRTAILESVRWNHIGRYRILLKHGADPCILSASPYDESEIGRVWSALHLFADQAHDEDFTLVDELLTAGIPVDGDKTHDIESPLSVSIRRNAFRLADHLRAKGASLETTSRRSALIASRWMLTILGNTIALNSRHSFDSLSYLLKVGANFMVCPDQGLTALHMCAMVPEGLTYLDGTPLKRSEFDMATNRTITRMILEHFNSPEQVDQRLLNIVPETLYPKIEEETGDLAGTFEFFAEHGETALHLAVEVGNVQIVELLVDAGADKELVCYNETLRFETAADIAERMWSDRHPQLFHRLRELLDN